MTQTGDPLHNALAERMNNTLKNSWFISEEMQTLEQAMARVVLMYNEAHRHQAHGGLTPMQIHQNRAHNLLVPSVEEKLEIAPKLYAKMRIPGKGLNLPV
ncbi:mobile element protein [Porphyromonas crevioricanis JCM 15906]|uniref:Integrase catalytic domain-containing protein n=2 Tax=Porphyromonas crevioricanis TaxID=393921 RepID=A0A2X4PMA5_9PORP|nr:integrase core domain-containing protein [Porphyromonas crevioricanis]GAD06034.1 mobile element protein [Porphyromonas crevioricanis JCM 15906]GAD06890.1 mobile element protein [Porphyromonas crevioricanis JCM 13913]SJZ73345.1 Integrase core domain-containing protein [Porphyromonas crevioricanis]SQH73495.1 Uncharacterised protein [Porphyromonas crevioricanis]